MVRIFTTESTHGLVIVPFEMLFKILIKFFNSYEPFSIIEITFVIQVAVFNFTVILWSS